MIIRLFMLLVVIIAGYAGYVGIYDAYPQVNFPLLAALIGMIVGGILRWRSLRSP